MKKKCYLCSVNSIIYMCKMKKFFFSLLLLLFCLSTIQAQDYAKSRQQWSDGPLDLKDFKGRLKSDTTIIGLSWLMQAQPKKEKIGNTKYIYYRISPTLDLSESAVKPGFLNDQTRKLAQASFDLLEIYGRKATQEVLSNHPDNVSDVIRYYNNQVDHRLDDLWYSTRYGQNEQQMDLATTAIALELEEAKIDPTQAELVEPTVCFDLSVGASMMMPSTAYLSSPCFGFGFSVGMGTGRHLISMEMNMGIGAECKKPIMTDNSDPIEVGESLNVGHLLLTYGYRVGNYRSNPFYPTVGIGLNTLVSPANDSSNSKQGPRSADGFVFTLGCTYDIPFARSAYVGTAANNSQIFMGNSEYNTSSIRLKAYFALANGGNEVGWFPSINLAVLFGMNGIRFK